MTDPEIVESCALGMGWAVFNDSAHRPGSRPLPHCWRWRRDGRDLLMVYDGKSNREWDPLTRDADRQELATRLGRPSLTVEEVRALTLPQNP